MSLIQAGKEVRHQVLEGRLRALPEGLDTSSADTFPSHLAEFASQFERSFQPHLPKPYSDDCVSCASVIARHRGEHPAPPIRDQFQADMDQQFSKLSPRAQKIAALPVMRLLGDVPNSAAAMTRFYRQADVDRECHSKHTAAKAHDLNPDVRGQLSQHEFDVLECAALLHDLGHRLGSHALDRILAAHQAAPEIELWGWGEEFHEFHTAILVAKDRDLRDALGHLHPDVLAVLTHCDNRPERGEMTSFAEHFGHFSPTLSSDRVALLAEIVEKVLDRDSCLELDFARSGFAGGYIQQAKELVRKFEAALVIHEGELRVRENSGLLPEGQPGWISVRDLDDYVACRQLFREVIAASAASCSVDVYLREAFYRGLRRIFGGDLSQHNSYEFMRSNCLQGKYEQVLNRDDLQILTKAPHDGELLSIDDIVAPLVTMKMGDFKKDSGKLAVVDEAQAKSVCGVARKDMTIFEFDLRAFLKLRRVKADVLVTTTNDFEKVISYKTIQPDGTLEDHPRFAVHSSSENMKVTIAARAIDWEGRPVPLGGLQELVERFCKEQDYLHPGCTTRYDRHLFAKPFLPDDVIERVDLEIDKDIAKAESHGEDDFRISTLRARIMRFRSAYDLFAPEVRERMQNPQLKWELMGKHGLRESDVR